MSQAKSVVTHNHNFPHFFDINDILTEPEEKQPTRPEYTYEDLIKTKTCPKCDTSNPFKLQITNTVFHCNCGFIVERRREEKPVTLEMINRPEPTNYNRRERKANGRFQEGQNG